MNAKTDKNNDDTERRFVSVKKYVFVFAFEGSKIFRKYGFLCEDYPLFFILKELFNR